MQKALGAVLLLVACSSEEASPADSTGDAGTGGSTHGSDAAPVPTDAAEAGPDPSPGCGRDLADPGDRITLESGGEERWALLSVPPAHDGTTPVPVVLDFHGYLEGAETHARMSDLGTYGTEQGFVTVTPHGRGDPVHWIFDADMADLDVSADNVDVVFTRDLLDHVGDILCIDRSRVYSTGLSNGGMMSTVLGCVLSDRIAAAAPVAGIVDVMPCEPEHPVPVVVFHGTQDLFIPYEGGIGSAALMLPTAGDASIGAGIVEGGTVPFLESSVPERIAAWAGRIGCTADASDEDVTSSVSRRVFSCPSGVGAELYTVEGGGHSWPGSAFSAQLEAALGPTTMDIDANALMWAFFSRHRR